MYSYVLGITLGALQAKYKTGKVIGYVYIGGCFYFYLFQDSRRTAFSFNYPILTVIILTLFKSSMLLIGDKIYNKIKNI